MASVVAVVIWKANEQYLVGKPGMRLGALLGCE